MLPRVTARLFLLCSQSSAVLVLLEALPGSEEEEEQQEVGGSTWLLPRHLQAVLRESRGEERQDGGNQPELPGRQHQSSHY